MGIGRPVPEEPLRRVLVVDDDPSLRHIIQLILTRAGLMVEVAADGAEALTLVATAQTPFDLVILDLTMPVMSGHDTILEIGRRYPKLPVVLCSGSVTELKAAAQSSPDCVVSVIAKPFSLMEFTQKIKDALHAQGSPCITLQELLRLELYMMMFKAVAL